MHGATRAGESPDSCPGVACFPTCFLKIKKFSVPYDVPASMPCSSGDELLIHTDREIRASGGNTWLIFHNSCTLLPGPCTLHPKCYISDSICYISDSHNRKAGLYSKKLLL